MAIVNVGLMKKPGNWLTVWLMLTLAGVLGHLILTWAGKSHLANSISQANSEAK